MAHAMERVESAAERMTTLVEDLLLLARLDTGRPVETEPVDLSELVIGAVSDAHAAAPDHTWRLDLPDEPVQVDGDRLQLHQVVANLLANARTHTAPGTTVSVSLRPAASATEAASRWPSTTTARASQSRCAPTFSSASPAATPRAREPPAAAASGWPSSPPSSPRTTAGWASPATPGDTRFTVWLPPQQPARVVTADA